MHFEKSIRVFQKRMKYNKMLAVIISGYGSKLFGGWGGFSKYSKISTFTE